MLHVGFNVTAIPHLRTALHLHLAAGTHQGIFTTAYISQTSNTKYPILRPRRDPVGKHPSPARTFASLRLCVRLCPDFMNRVHGTGNTMEQNRSRGLQPRIVPLPTHCLCKSLGGMPPGKLPLPGQKSADVSPAQRMNVWAQTTVTTHGYQGKQCSRNAQSGFAADTPRPRAGIVWGNRLWWPGWV
jgi:hypothetical protein